MIGSYAYTDTQVIKARNNQGNQLWNVPRNAGSLWAKYDFKYGDLHGLSLGAGAYFQSKKQGDVANTFQLPGWGRIDAMIKYKLPLTNKTNATLQLNVENLLDHKYYAATSGNQFFVNPGAPRTFIGSIRLEF